MLHSHFLSFYLMSFFSVWKSHLGNHSKLSCQVSLGSFWLWQLLRFDDLERSTGQVFCWTPLTWSLSDTFLMIRLELCVLGKKTTEVKALLITSYHEYMLSTWVIANDVDLDHVAEVVFVRSFHCKVTLFPPFSAVFFGRKSLCTTHT